MSVLEPGFAGPAAREAHGGSQASSMELRARAGSSVVRWRSRCPTPSVPRLPTNGPTAMPRKRRSSNQAGDSRSLVWPPRGQGLADMKRPVPRAIEFACEAADRPELPLHSRAIDSIAFSRTTPAFPLNRCRRGLPGAGEFPGRGIRRGGGGEFASLSISLPPSLAARPSTITSKDCVRGRGSRGKPE